MTLRYHHLSKGITLIEAIISITLVSLLFTGLFAVYIQMEEVIHQQQEHSQRGSQIFEAIDTIQTDIKNLCYEKWNQDYYFIGKKEIVHGKRIDTLSFQSGSLYSIPATMQPQIYNVSYEGAFDADTDLLTLYRKEGRFSVRDSTPKGVPLVLISDIEKFEVNYSLNANTWEEFWDFNDKKSPPRFIRIRIEWKEGDLSREYETIVSPGLLL